jgi:hypothetical protein
MAEKKNQQFRVSKISVLKSIARRPKGLLRPSKVEKPKTIYSRTRQKQELKKMERKENLTTD